MNVIGVFLHTRYNLKHAKLFFFGGCDQKQVHITGSSFIIQPHLFTAGGALVVFSCI